MFGVKERVDSNLHEDDEKHVKEFLEDFGNVVEEALESHALEAHHNPYGRPANVLVLIDPDNLHLVVDDTATKSPVHVYRNESARGSLLDLRVVMEAASRDAGFEKPLGLTFPNRVMVMERADRKAMLAGSVAEIMKGLKSRLEGTS